VTYCTKFRRDWFRHSKVLSSSLCSFIPFTLTSLGFTAFELCFRICHWEGPGKPGGTEIKWDTSSGDISPGVTRQGLEADHSVPSSPGIKNCGAIHSLPYMSSGRIV
jgi:hypothetical protein